MLPAADALDPDNNPWHWVSVDLRVWRIERNKSQADVADILGLESSTVSNIEAGRSKLTTENARKLDVAWRTRGHFERMVRMAESKHDPDWYKQSLSYERRAALIRAYESLWVPGLVQIEEYALASFEAAGATDPDRLWRDRKARQEILHRENPPQLQVLLDQAVILRQVGGVEVMCRQLQRLLELSHLPHVILRVIPFDEGAHMGQDGSFKIMSATRGQRRSGWDAVYAEAPIGGRLITDPAKAADFWIRWDRIGAKALTVAGTRRLILSTMESMR
ncbi:hypothetical protein GCM10022214_33630 [Actinomadura miaoliensis]|uniref:HTH cro/C1-type domain-containing protein n=2 Tax=Actinomadura miaoliensis TaxID=430685 RepID=A0ABP7VTL4_9ACTN